MGPLALVGAVAWILAGPSLAQLADEVERRTDRSADRSEGRLIHVRLPLVGNADSRIKAIVQRALDQLEVAARRQPDRRPLLIFEFVPARQGNGYGRGTDFERALSLARYLASKELAPIKTVAYIPRTIKGHGVLVALACEEIVMAPQAEIGDAGIDEDEDRNIEDGIVSWYQQISEARRTVPEAIALGMLDRRREVLKVETDVGTDFILADQLDDLRQTRTIISEETLVPSGAMGTFTGREGREYGFVKYLAEDREGLARVLRVSSDALTEDQSLMEEWRPVMLTIEGPITRHVVHQVQTLIGSEIDQRGANWIGLRIDSTGGELEDCLRLAASLAGLDPTEVRTVAYVPREASGGAALVAMACDQIVMQPKATVGGPGTVELDQAVIDSAGTTIRETLADATEQSWSLLLATIDPNLSVYRYRNTKTGEVRYLSDDEASSLPDADDWQRGPAVTEDGKPLTLDSNQAQAIGVAWRVVDNYDELKELYGFTEDPRVVAPNWALELIEALSSPALAVLLVVIGFVGIYVELHSPGIGVGGFVSAVAFMLFFWSKFLYGTAGWLEVLLFVGGVCFILLEIFALPGLGIFGLGGGLMIIASLILASQTFILPQTPSQLAELRNSVLVVVAAIFCTIAIAVAIRRHLPNMPLLRTMMLEPPPAEELAELGQRETVADFSPLVGHRGKATTDLMPAGKAMIEGRLIDVIAEPDVVERGRAVEVVSARGNRVVVRAVDV